MQQGKKSKQLKALLLKNLRLQSRQPCTNICQVITPIICLVFTILIRDVAIENLPNDNDTVYDKIPFFPFKFNNYSIEDQFPQFVQRECEQWFLYQIQNPDDLAFVGTRDGLQPNSGMFAHIPNNYRFLCGFNITGTCAPRHLEWLHPPILRTTNSSINHQLFGLYNDYNAMNFSDLHYRGGDKMPDGAVSFRHINQTTMQADIKINDLRTLEYHRADGVTRIRFWIEKMQVYSSFYTISQGLLSLMQMLNSAYLSTIHSQHSLQSGALYMPFVQSTSAGVDILISTVSSVLFPLSLSLLLPVFLYVLVLQKQQKLVQMMRMNGMKMKYYWFVNFIFNFILSILTNVVFCVFGYVFMDASIFRNTGWDLLVVVLIGWILAQIGMATFLQVFISSSRSANIIGYLFSIWTNLIGATLSVALYQYPHPLPTLPSLVPTFAFNRIFYLMFTNCSADHCYPNLQQIDDEVKHCLLVLYLGFVVFQLLGMYLYEVVPQEYGTSQPLTFPLKFLRKQNSNHTSSISSNSSSSRTHHLQHYDGEVKKERYRVREVKDHQQYALVCEGLRKVYPNGKLALQGMDLIVDDKQIFGLLGPNGAGKTTLISMITGMLSTTEGNAFVGGHSILDSIDQVHLEMGVCPQFDILWPQLTVEEHLYFYTRLRGTNNEHTAVQTALEEVSLKQFRKFKAKQLSGGMKRRLSVGISMVGNPRIIFLDEPTTGLDPENRRNLWQVLAKCKENRSLFLTTHLMQQAETLCNRIGIITNGVLRTVGNQLQLKKLYGSGYHLSLNIEIPKPEPSFHLPSESVESEGSLPLSEQIDSYSSSPFINETVVMNAPSVESIKQRVQKLFPSCTLVKEINGYLRYNLGKVKISEVMEILNSQDEHIRNGWALSNSTLEDVFLAVVTKFDAQHDESIVETVLEEEAAPAPMMERASIQEEQ